MGRVTGKTAIVTGAASGLGASAVGLFAREGADVGTANLRDGEGLAASLCREGLSACFPHSDFTAEDSWRVAIDRTQSSFGGLDISVNNAYAAFPNGSVEQQTLADRRLVMSVNREGAFLGRKFATAAMRKAGQGDSIVNLSSILGIAASPTSAAYCAARGGVRQMTQPAALHCAEAGYRIRVNSIYPGYLSTQMLKIPLARPGDVEGQKCLIEARIPMCSMSAPDDRAYGLLYLASDETKHVTRTELVIDGRYHAQ